MPPVILLHGFAQTPASWDEVARRLQAQGHRTYVLDLYKRVEDDMGELCQHVAETVRRVADVEGEPILVGYSMGGRIAAETLVRHGFFCHPERAQRSEGAPGDSLPLAALVLESAGLGPADEGVRATLAERNAAWAARLREEGVEAFMDWWETLPLFATQRDLPESTRAAIRAERTFHAADALAFSLEAWGAHSQTPEPETIATLAQAHNQGLPILYLAGELDEKYAAMAKRTQQAHLPTALIPGVGHNTHLEGLDAFLQIVTHKLPLLC